MRIVDLHAHTTASDGTLRPRELVALAAESGLAAVAVTDHDTLEGYAEARAEGERRGVEVLPGVELSCACAAGQLHLLGLLVDPEHAPLQATLAELRQDRETRAARIVERLQALGLDVSEEDVRREAGDGAVGRPHVARALMTRGHVGSVQEAFDRYLADHGPATVPKRMLMPAEAIRLVHDAGGVAVMAHPRTIRAAHREALVRSLARAGIDGLEVDHSSHDPALRVEMMALAQELGLVATGGSDFHGANKPQVRLGSGVEENVRVPYATLEALRGAARWVRSVTEGTDTT